MTDDQENLPSRINALESAAYIAEAEGQILFAEELKEQAEALRRKLQGETQ